MGKITRRRHTREFKVSLIRELESGKNLAQLSRENNLHPTMISRWRLEYRKIQNQPLAAMVIPIKKQQRIMNWKGLWASYTLRMNFKKSLEHLGKEDSGGERKVKGGVKFMLISDSLGSVSVNRAAELLEASRSEFYKWFQRSISSDSDPNLEIRIREEIQNIVIEFPGYGYRRVTIELQNRGYSVKEKIVRKFMKEDNLLCVKKRFKLRTTDSNHGEKTYPNLARDLKITGINQLWVADITYIRLLKEFVFLCEEVYLNEYATFNDALANIDRFIEEVYNSKRLHSSIGYKSPINFERALTLNIVA